MAVRMSGQADRNDNAGLSLVARASGEWAAAAPELQREFADYESYLAFKRARLAGLVTIVRPSRGVIHSSPPTGRSTVSRAATGAMITPGDRSVLKRHWELNQPNEQGVPLQDEFGGDYDAFVAYSRHEAAGDITICARR